MNSEWHWWWLLFSPIPYWIIVVAFGKKRDEPIDPEEEELWWKSIK